MSKTRLGGQPTFNPYDQPPAPEGEAHEFTQREVKEYKGLKIKPKKQDENKPKSERLLKEEAKERMNNIADRIVEDRANRNKRMIKLVKDILSQINDKTLKRNKTPIAEAIETDTRKGLVDLAIETNNDDTEDFADMGSIALISLLLKLLMNTRDRINDLEYFIGGQSREIEVLKTQLKNGRDSKGGSDGS